MLRIETDPALELHRRRHYATRPAEMSDNRTEKSDPLRRSAVHVLDIIGEGWSILIIREAFLGTRRFEEFQRRLGIARNILTARLKKLCANEILDRVPVKEGARRHEYVLTDKGKASR